MILPPGFVDVSVIQRAGVYLLLWKGEVVYVGKSVKAYTRIATHITQKGRPRKQMLSSRSLPAMRFDQVAVMPCLLSDLDRIEMELIKKYLPRYNLRSVKPTIPLEDLIASVVPTLPAAPEPRWPSWRRL